LVRQFAKQSFTFSLSKLAVVSFCLLIIAFFIRFVQLKNGNQCGKINLDHY